MITICHIAGTARRGQDGVTRVLYEYLRRHQDAGFEPLVITAIADQEQPSQFKTIEVPALRLPVYRDYKLYVGGYRRIEFHLFNQGRMPDLIHIHTPCPLGRAAIRCAQRHGIPVIATYHTHFPSYLQHHRADILRWAVEHSLIQLYQQCDRVLVPSRLLVEELQQRGIQTAQYLAHGVDTHDFHPRYASMKWRTRHQIKADQIVLLYVGRLVWEKNLRVLVEVWNRLDKRRYAMVIVGSGPIVRQLERLMPGARFLGYQRGHELAESYASSDVFVFPSNTETFGNVTLEALACGLPCIVSSSPGSSELVQHGKTGYCVDPTHVDEFICAIESIAKLPPLQRMMWRMRARLSAERYQWNWICGELFRHYRELLTARSLPHLTKPTTDYTASLSNP